MFVNDSDHHSVILRNINLEAAEVFFQITEVYWTAFPETNISFREVNVHQGGHIPLEHPKDGMFKISWTSHSGRRRQDTAGAFFAKLGEWAVR